MNDTKTAPDQDNFETEEEYFKACREHRKTMNNKTAEEILKSNLKDIYCIRPEDTYAQVLKSMEEYASPLKKRIEELEAASKEILRFKKSLDYVVEKEFQYAPNCLSALNKLDELLNPSTNGK